MPSLSRTLLAIGATALCLGLPLPAARSAPPAPAPGASQPVLQPTIHYRSKTIDGVDVFYREAGPADAPVLLLLHGFPSSSHMFRNLIPLLADRYRVIAPDYPGFGHSAVPDRARFSYGFAAYAGLVDRLMGELHASSYALYVMDYGAPVGYRLALMHPERVTALVVQNGNAYEEGLSPFWTPLKAYWADGSQANRNALRAGLTREATRTQYVNGVSDVSRIDPDTWLVDQALLDRPGVDEIMLDLFKDYASNVALYPAFHAFFRERHPPTLVVWGANDEIFPAAGAQAYLKDLPKAELYLLDSGHFALEDKGPEIATLMRDFLARSLPVKGNRPAAR
ncbi:UNVERIFIED_ORG: pimeloyl-ACP methyl ester carboxylesterase [Xanthobacter viscosus]|uniref:Alpha/beta hydrolase n=1 Tax=Xanthobacter autotrophicus TaxID=280 RepID=A0A6C1KHH7_XANAU|nr:alpha/beta hydrolase [Xanthobacter autotrophicus]TLX43738.1 alpha/beta hydrolase [Xanthobacter autotrophicus]